ncbi:MAG: hypothetical protein RIC16_12235 [Rhodospirillales bacterium]
MIPIIAVDIILMERCVDLERFPINAPGTPEYRRLIDDCQTGLGRNGAAVLEGFLRAETLAPAVQEIEPALADAFYKTKTHNAYLLADDVELEDNHPRNRKQTTNSATLGYDRIPADSTINRLYLWPAFQSFLADVLGLEALFPYADPLTPLNVLIYGEGAMLGWHFDLPPFVVTLMLQQSEKGGVYEYAPFIRSDDDENYAAVADVLDGRSDAVRELRQPPGALVIFRGNRTLHRVTAVVGQSPRLAAAFSYATEPGTESPEHNRMTFYGRVS